MTLSRRSMLVAVAALSGSWMVAGCKTLQNGSKTTHTLDVAKINSYGKAGLNAAATIASALAFVPALERFVTPVRDVTIAIQKDLEDFTKAVAGKVEIVYDDANWKTIIDSILANLDKLLGIVKLILKSDLVSQIGATNDIVKKVNLVSDALNTIVAIFSTLTAGFISTASGGMPEMTEAQALAALGQ